MELKRGKNRFLRLLLILLMVIGILPVMSLNVNAAEVSESITTMDGGRTYSGTHFEVWGGIGDYRGLLVGYHSDKKYFATVRSRNNEIIKKIEAEITFMNYDASLLVDKGTLSGFEYKEGGSCDITVDNINATAVAFTQRDDEDMLAFVYITKWTIYYDSPDVSSVTYKVVNGTWSDGTTADKTETVASGSKPASVPTGMKANTGFTGGAWDTDPSTATITGATTFTYTFDAIPTHTVTFNAKNGTDPVTVTVENGRTVSDKKPDRPEKSGWYFKGWFTDEACTQEYDFDTPVTGDLTLYADWYVVIFYDSYNTPDGTLSKDNKVKFNDKEPSAAAMYNVYEGEELSLTPQAADGYRFVGWVKSETEATDPSKCFSTANPLKITCSLDALNGFGRRRYADLGIDAYSAVALFEKIPTYTVTYKVVNGTWSDGATTDKTETVESGSKPASVPTGMKANTGFTGGAWDTDPAGTEITQATTFTYTFEKTSAPAILTFDLKGGTLNGRSGIITINANVGDTVNLPAAPTREGYTFQYWKGSEYEAGARYKVTGDHTFTAEWKKADKETDDSKDGSSDSGKKTAPIKTDSVVTCQMAGYPANYSWNEAAKACQPGYTDANGTFHPYRSAYKVVPNTYDRGFAGYAWSLALSFVTALFCGFLLLSEKHHN